MPNNTDEPPVTANIDLSRSISYFSIPFYLQKHIKDQAEKRQLSENEILSECIQYHKENAGTWWKY